ncbi:hypothetical protein M1O20_02220 [Dehalococcoidia bacterium]|nr:hypothetical protein [Dehalococcoidia bacterium]
MIEKRWQWIDWTSDYDMGGYGRGRKVMLMAECPKCCGKLRLKAEGYRYSYLGGPKYGYRHLGWDYPHFELDFNGTITLICRQGCGYRGDFFLDVPHRKVVMVREVCSREGYDFSKAMSWPLRDRQFVKTGTGVSKNSTDQKRSGHWLVGKWEQVKRWFNDRCDVS